MKTEEMKTLATGIVKAGWEAGKDEDDIKMDMFTAKIPFGKLNTLFKNCSIELGFMADPKEVTDGLKEVLEGYGDKIELADWAAVESTLAHMAGQVEGATPQRALSLLKAHCRDNEIEFPKKPAGAAGAPRAGKLANAIVDLVNSAKDATKAQAFEVIYPLVGGQMKYKNALYYVNTTFAHCMAIANAQPLAETIANINGQVDPEDPKADDAPATEDGEIAEDELA